MNTTEVRDYLLGLQRSIVSQLEQVDGNAFLSDGWTREPGGRLEGDGLSRLIEGGSVFERGGQLLARQGPRAAALGHAAPSRAGRCAFSRPWGCRWCLHPHNPFVPTVHANVRMFAALPADREASRLVRRWHGPDALLRLSRRDAQHFHRVCRDAIGAERYPAYKTWCDEYFFLKKHRSEPRGIGGIFFDDVTDGGFEGGFALIRAVGDAFPRPTFPSSNAARLRLYEQRQRDFRPTGAAATSSSTSCLTAARCSACSRAGAPSPS